MSVSEELVKILACPETHQPVSMAQQELVDKLNEGIARGEVVNVGGEKVSEPMEAALVRQDGEIAYPVREGIPQMLVEEGIGLGKLQ